MLHSKRILVLVAVQVCLVEIRSLVKSNELKIWKPYHLQELSTVAITSRQDVQWIVRAGPSINLENTNEIELYEVKWCTRGINARKWTLNGSI